MLIPVGQIKLSIEAEEVSNLQRLLWACIDKTLRAIDADMNLKGVAVHLTDGVLTVDLDASPAWEAGGGGATYSRPPEVPQQRQPTDNEEIGDDEWFLKV